MSDSSSSGSSNSFTLPDPQPINVPISIPTTLTESEIIALFPSAQPVDDLSPEVKELIPLNNAWERIANFVVDGIEMWLLKKLGWLLIIEAIEEEN